MFAYLFVGKRTRLRKKKKRKKKKKKKKEMPPDTSPEKCSMIVTIINILKRNLKKGTSL